MNGLQQLYQLNKIKTIRDKNMNISNGYFLGHIWGLFELYSLYTFAFIHF